MPGAVPAWKFRNVRRNSTHVSHSRQKLVLKWFLCARQRGMTLFRNRLLENGSLDHLIFLLQSGSTRVFTGFVFTRDGGSQSYSFV